SRGRSQQRAPVGLSDRSSRLIVAQDCSPEGVAGRRYARKREDDHLDRLAGAKWQAVEQQLTVLREDGLNPVGWCHQRSSRSDYERIVRAAERAVKGPDETGNVPLEVVRS